MTKKTNKKRRYNNLFKFELVAKVKVLLIYFIFCIFLTSSTLLNGQPTIEAIEVKKLYEKIGNIDQIIIRKYGLIDKPFYKERFLKHAHIWNIYSKVLLLVELYFSTVSSSEKTAFEILRQENEAITPNAITLRNVYDLVNKIEEDLTGNSQNQTQTLGEKSAWKEPFISGEALSNIFEALRKVEEHIIEAAQKGGYLLTWGRPQKVFEEHIFKMLPAIYALAKKENISHGHYHFPLEPINKVKPRHVFKLEELIYFNLVKYYKKTKNHNNSFILNEIKNLERITPTDVLNLANLIVSEIKFINNNKLDIIDTKTYNNYKLWAMQKGIIVPGDVVQIAKHLYLITKKLNALETAPQFLNK